MERWCGVLGVEQCWLLVAVFSELNGGSHKVVNRNKVCWCGGLGADTVLSGLKQASS